MKKGPVFLTHSVDEYNSYSVMLATDKLIFYASDFSQYQLKTSYAITVA